MTLQSMVRRIMALMNDASAIERAAETGDPTYITNRIGRRAVYRAANQISNTLFPPHRGRRRKS